MRYFNTAGPCNPVDHYMIPAATRLQGVEQMVDMKQYFVIHAARQSGKTTYLQDLADRLNAGGRYYVLYCSLEGLQEFPEPSMGIPELVKNLRNTLVRYRFPYASDFAANADYANPSDVLRNELSLYCERLDKPFVILFDEADVMSEGMLITFLRQLRYGYIERSRTPFAHSVALVGMRNIRDYKAHVRPDSATLGSASPFNIVKEALTLKNFTKEEIAALYQQHTDEQGQRFEDGVVDLVYEQTYGQPWLVNAIVSEVIGKILHYDYTQPITPAMVREAIHAIVLRRDTHVDSMLERLKEPRVQSVVEPIITGRHIETDTDDFSYVCDLGLVRVTPTAIEPSNPIYAELMVRALNRGMQDTLQRQCPQYQMPRYIKDGRIDMDFLMCEFQQFWRENSGIWEERFNYKEAAPHLILMAFLQRVVNGVGDVVREMALDSDRLDLCVRYHDQRYPIELKIWRGEQTLKNALLQTAKYATTLGVTEAWLIMFDRSSDASWDEKIYMRKQAVEGGKTITIVGA